MYMAGQSSLNTLQALEEVIRANPSIKKAVILPRPPRRDDLRLHLLSQLGSRVLKNALEDSPFKDKIHLGDYTSLQPRTAAQEEELFGSGDGIHLTTLPGRRLLTSAVIQSIKPLVDFL